MTPEEQTTTVERLRAAGTEQARREQAALADLAARGLLEAGFGAGGSLRAWAKAVRETLVRHGLDENGNAVTTDGPSLAPEDVALLHEQVTRLLAPHGVSSLREPCWTETVAWAARHPSLRGTAKRMATHYLNRLALTVEKEVR